VLRVVGEALYPRGGWARAFHYVKHRVRRLPDSPERIARGIWAGVFVTFTPLYTMHFIVAALIARLIQGNILAALMATFFGNPLTYVLNPPESHWGTAANVGQRLSDRGRFTDTVDSILYESTDSYAQLRLIYLQNRRFQLGQENPVQEIDPFALETEGF